MENFIGQSFTHDEQPYGAKTFNIASITPITVETYGNHDYVKHCQKEGLFEISGIVTEGSTTNRLMGHSHTTSEKGRNHSVWAVSKEDIIRGSKITVAM